MSYLSGFFTGYFKGEKTVCEGCERNVFVDDTELGTIYDEDGNVEASGLFCPECLE